MNSSGIHCHHSTPQPTASNTHAHTCIEQLTRYTATTVFKTSLWLTHFSVLQRKGASPQSKKTTTTICTFRYCPELTCPGDLLQKQPGEGVLIFSSVTTTYWRIQRHTSLRTGNKFRSDRGPCKPSKGKRASTLQHTTHSEELIALVYSTSTSIRELQCSTIEIFCPDTTNASTATSNDDTAAKRSGITVTFFSPGTFLIDWIKP